MSGKAAGISLPQGGGAVRGLGESFQPDLHTGTGNLTVPIELPAGRAGTAPALALSYSTGNANGFFGMGWSLAVPSIRRKTSAGLPRYGPSDTFVLAGAEDLVAVPGGSPGRARFRPRVEGVFARIEHVTGGGADYWEVRGGDGMVSRYGTPCPAGAPADWRDPAAISDPADPRRVFGWLLSQVADPSGNAVAYRYERDGDPAVLGYDQLRLAEVSYVDVPGEDPSAPEYLVTIRLRYAERPDAFSGRRAGFEIRTTRRCTAIETWTPGRDGPVLAKVVALEYQNASPGSGRSLLTGLRVEGHDGDDVQALPPLEFGYTAFTPERRRYEPVTAAPGGGLPAQSLVGGSLELADLFGDGLPCLLELNGQARYWRNTGGARFEGPRTMTAAPPVSLAESGVQLADMNGDGRADLLISQPPLSGYYPLTASGTFDPGGFVPYRLAPAMNLEDPQVKLIDVDGDGVLDALRTGTSYEIYYNDARTGWSGAQLLRRGAHGVPDVDLADPRVKIADMSGDGLADLVTVHDRQLQYWPYLGYGRWGSPVVMGNSPRFADAGIYGSTGFDPRRLLIGDVDGDGAADVVYVGDDQVTVWINQSGHGFTDPVVIAGTPRVADTDAVRLVDLLGTGTAGILWTAGTQRGTGYAFLDLTGGTKPYLLNALDNHRGAQTRIEYAPSTRYLLADAEAGRPWRTTLPFPVHVVASVSSRDEFSGATLSTEYRYHHGYWDGAEREFRGFARIDQFDTVTGSGGVHWSPPTETRSWFHSGPVGPESGTWSELDLRDEYWAGDPDRLGAAEVDLPGPVPRRAQRDAVRSLAGRPLRSELYARDGDAEREDRPYTVTEHRYGVTAILDGRPAGEWAAAPVVFAHPVDERVSQWERGDDPMHHFTFTGGYDQYGRPRVHAEAGIPRGHDPHAGTGDGSAGRILMTATATGYATRDDGGGYLLNRAVSVTRLQVLDDGKAGVSGLWASFAAGTATATVLGHQVSHYDGDPFTGLSYGQVGDRGLVSREAQLVHTDASLAAAFPAGLPPYLDPDAAWPAGAGPEYPPEFRESVPHGAGYRRHVGEPGYEDGWYAETGSAYDGRGNVVTARDTQGNDTSVAYDRSGLLPVAVTDPGGMTTTAAYDYRVLQPSLTTDVNGNRTAYWYTPLGLLATVALLGRPGEQTGDTPGQPGLRYEYGLSAYDDRPASPRQPLWVHTTQRVQHRWDLVADENERRATAGQPPLTDEEISALFPADERDASPERFLRTQEYSDGFGRPLQTRAQADDIVLDDLGLPVDPDTPAGDAVTYRQPPSEDPQVAVSGWQTYDNKGRVVEKFEPLFGTGWNYAQPIPPGTSTDPTGPRSLAGVMIELGPPRSTMYYDPPGRLVRTVRPDGSVQLAVHGVPAALADPAHYRPTPWELYQYDGNDNAGRTHPAESASYSGHWNTPASHVVDALGRVIEAVQRIDSRTLVTRTSYDIDGNATEITDPLGRTASRNAFDLLKRAWRTELLDAGAAHIILDPAGGMAEHRDAKGAITLTAYDALHRPVRVWAGDRAGDPVTLRELTRYGDAEPGLTREAAAAANLLGRVHQAYDEAGRVTTASYDLQGHATETERRVLRTDILLGGLPSGSGDWTGTAYRADWSGPGIDGLLDPVGYAVSSRFDAAGRRTQVTGPAGEGDGRVTLTATYSRAGHLATVAVDGLPYLRESLYDATGKRLLAVLANGVMTRYAYDEHTFRLARLRSEVCLARPGDFAGWRPAGTVHQDHGYQYDLVGNLVALLDRTPGCGVAPGDPNRLARQFRYDPLYRLLAASGRECQASAPPPPWTDIPRCTDVTSTRPYSESYSYDDAGGLLQIAHTGLTGGYTRDLIPAPGSNRLATLDTAGIRYAYTYDPAGNLSTETASRHHEWDHANRLATFRSQPLGSAAEPSVYAQYRYDASGQRVVKARRNQGGALAVTVYIGDLFERLVVTSASGAQTTHDTVHVSDMGARIATRRIGQPAPGDSAPPLTFQLGDHLGSVGVVLDDTGGLVNREEFTPFGETTFGSYTRKRYRFTGKERDEESGYSYHRARYYAPWLARWTSADPIGIADGLNRYAYVGNRPTVRVDHAGTEGHDPKQMFLSQAPAYRQMITATKTGRGIGQWLRDAYQKAAEMWGQPGPVDVGHLDKPHVLLRDGERAVTFAQDRSENRSQAGAERAAAADARAARRFARDSKGYDPTSPGGRNPRTPRNPALTSPEFKNWQPPTPPPPAAAPPPSVPAPAPVARPAPQQLDLDFSKPAATPPAPAGPVGGAGGTVAKVGSGLGSGLGSVGRFVLAHLPSLAGMALGHYSGKAANAIMTSGITLTPQQQEQHAIQMLPLGYAPPGVDILIAYDVRLLTDKFSSLFNDWDIGNLYGVPR